MTGYGSSQAKAAAKQILADNTRAPHGNDPFKMLLSQLFQRPSDKCGLCAAQQQTVAAATEKLTKRCLCEMVFECWSYPGGRTYIYIYMYMYTVYIYLYIYLSIYLSISLSVCDGMHDSLHYKDRDQRSVAVAPLLTGLLPRATRLQSRIVTSTAHTSAVSHRVAAASSGP